MSEHPHAPDGSVGSARAHTATGLFRVPPRLLIVTLSILIGYAILITSTFGLRAEHLVVIGIVLAALLWNDRSRDFLRNLYPLLLIGIVFDTSRLLMPLLQYLTVHVAEPYAFDKAVFGIKTAHGVVTPNEYFIDRHWPWLDFVTGSAYILYLYVALGLMFYLALFRRDHEGRRLLRRFGWAFLGLNLMGIATYYIYPAAPPWYVASHGFGPADLSTPPNPAATIRWDALTGLNYFQGFYARGASVFGAIPSLHAGYPLLTFLYLKKLGRPVLSVAGFLFFLLVCFSAVYLQHHYILDLAVGAAYALLAFGVESVWSRRSSEASETAAVTGPM